MKTVLVVAVITYAPVGAFGAIFWWKRGHEDMRDAGPIPAVGAALGPAAWVVGYLIHRAGGAE